MRANNHVHTRGDGRGRRDVFLNGRPVDYVVYADTRAGFVRVIRMAGNNVKLDKRKKRILNRTLRGLVEIRKNPA